MAVTSASLTSNFDISSAATSVTASVSPTANRLVLLDIFTIAVSAASSADPTVSGGGMTWTKDISTNDTAAGMNLIRWRGLTASPGSGAVTITHASTPNFCAWSIHEHDGVDTGGTNGATAIVQTVTNKDVSGASATITATLAAFGSVNNGACAAFGFFNASAVPTATPDTGWTEIDEQANVTANAALAGGLETQFRATNDTSAVVTWSLAGGLMALASELKAAGAVADTLWAQSVM